MLQGGSNLFFILWSFVFVVMTGDVNLNQFLELLPCWLDVV